jgi:putative FmdB family regulatory protein
MPLYTYECNCGKEFDRVLPISDCDKPQGCPNCDGRGHRIITLGHGGIFRTGDSIPWVRSMSEILTDGDGPNPNMETIQDMRQFYRDHPNIIPADSHPSLPSSMGDELYKKPDLKAEKAARSKKAKEKLRELRAISVAGRAS